MSLKLKWDNLRKGDKFFLGFGILLMILNVLGILMILNGKIETELDFTSVIFCRLALDDIQLDIQKKNKTSQH